MLNEIVRHSIRFFVLVLVQGLILKNMDVAPYVNPFIYLLFLMQLPFDMPPWLVMLIAFVTGFFVDVFYGTIGMHMAASTLVGFMRSRILKMLAPRDGYEFSAQPTVQDMGWVWFLTYAGIFIFIHHFCLFYLEMFSFREFFSTFLRVLISGMATMLLVVVTQFLFYRSKKAL
jgi:rod shape-determining protein MreD